VYPALLAMVVLILSRPNPQRLLAAYLAGGMLTSIVVGMVVVSSLKTGHVVNGSDRTVNPVVDLAVALFAFVLLWVLLTGRDRTFRAWRARRHERPAAEAAKDSWWQRVLRRDSILLTFAIGIALNLPGALYLVALKDIAAAGHGTGTDLGLIVVYNVIMFQWAVTPLIAYSLAPERTRATIGTVNAWLGSHGRQIAMVICALAAVLLSVRGIGAL
jgi:hypothetical protein